MPNYLPAFPAPSSVAAPVAAWVLGLCLAVAGPPARAQASPPAPEGVLTLSASASVELAQDWMSLALSVSRDGADAAVVQNQLKLALDSALTEARKSARPGQLEVRTGGFAVYPRYGAKGQLSGWQGSAELLIEGRDMSAIGLISGRIASMTIKRVGYGLSREAREQAEVEATAQAIARFRLRAAAQAQAFGYQGFKLREVSVSADSGPGAEPPQPQAMVARMKVADSEALPVEAGKAVVNATVSGSIQLH